MIKKIFKKWIDICYSGMMLGRTDKKAPEWKKGMIVIFNYYYYFFATALLANIYLALFPFKGVFMAVFYVLHIINAFYVFSYNNFFDNLLLKIDYDPTINYKKNKIYEVLGLISLLFSIVLMFWFFILSFYVFNYFKYLIGGMFN